MSYDLSKIVLVVQSGWTGDIYLSNDEADILNGGEILVWRNSPLHTALTELVYAWPCVEDNDGGVLTYTRPAEVLRNDE